MTITAILAFAACAMLLPDSARGQGAPPQTRVGAHRLGETVAEWNAITHTLDGLDVACAGKKNRRPGNCDLLLGIRDGTRDTIMDDASEDRSYTWKFTSGRLSEVHINIPGQLALSNHRPDVQQEIGFLIQAYGKPAEERVIPYQNSYGAKWDCVRDFWELPDGARLIASESIGNPTYGGPRRELLILFVTKDVAEKETQRASPNPYK